MASCCPGPASPSRLGFAWTVLFPCFCCPSPVRFVSTRICFFSLWIFALEKAFDLLNFMRVQGPCCPSATSATEWWSRCICLHIGSSKASQFDCSSQIGPQCFPVSSPRWPWVSLSLCASEAQCPPMLGSYRPWSCQWVAHWGDSWGDLTA